MEKVNAIKYSNWSELHNNKIILCKRAYDKSEESMTSNPYKLSQNALETVCVVMRIPIDTCLYLLVYITYII